MKDLLREIADDLSDEDLDGAIDEIDEDGSGKIQFEGPWDTPQDKASAPPDVRDRIEAVSGMFGDGAGMLQMEVVPAPEDKPKPKEQPGKDE